MHAAIYSVRVALAARAVLAGLGVFLVLTIAGPALAQSDADVARGAYLVHAGGCMACHTAIPGGTPFAGGRALETPFGIFYSPNITPHPEYGLGAWSDDDFVRALQQGVRPDGAYYFPVFPYTSYTKVTREDALAIKAYLFSQPPAATPNRAHGAPFPFSWRFLQRFWRWLNFREGRFRPDPAADAVVNRGRYLTDALSHCGECHTPRNLMGGLDNAMYLAGTQNGPDGGSVPNITPHTTGIGDWSEGEITQLLHTGLKPDFDNVQGAMAEAVDEGLQYLTPADLMAIAAYLKTVPAVDNAIVSGPNR